MLCAVFVPMAFLSGVTGQFYQQFAVTIAISTVISAINSLTLSPALAAKLLQPHAPRDALARVIDKQPGLVLPALQPLLRSQRPGYQNSVGRSLRSTRPGVRGLCGAAGRHCRAVPCRVPGGFIPMQDKLYLFAGAKLPEGASLNRTDAVTPRWWRRPKSVDGVDMVAAFAGFNALQSTTTPNLTSSYIMLKPFGERAQRRGHQCRTGCQVRADRGGFAYALMPPPIQGLGNGSRAIRCSCRTAQAPWLCGAAAGA